MNRLIHLLGAFIIVLSLESKAQESLYSSIVEELSRYNTLGKTATDTLRRNNRVFYIPRVSNSLYKSIIGADIVECTGNSDYENAEISYSVKQLSDSFVSIVKSVYIENAGSPKGYFLWDESLNYYKVSGEKYRLGFVFSKGAIDSLLLRAVEVGTIEGLCLGEDVITAEYLNYFISSGKLHLHNPISFPCCWFEMDFSFGRDNIVFEKLHK